MDNVRSKIEAINLKFATFLSKGDAAGLSLLYTANARLLPPDADIQQGQKAIQAFWQVVLDSGVNGGQLQTVDVEEFGESLAREIGKFTLHIQQGAETVSARGKYVVIWKQEDGIWKLDVDIWNNTLST